MNGIFRKVALTVLFVYPYLIILCEAIFHLEYFIGDEAVTSLVWSAFISIAVQWLLFMIDAIRNKNLNKSKHQRSDWVLGIIFGFPMAVPFYWYMHVLHQQKTTIG